MAEISQIKLPSGTVYDIKDATARAQVGGAIIIRGTTTTALTDEATTNPITIDGESYTAVANDAVFYQKKEFVFDGTKWHEFGDMSGLGALAMKDSASGSFTPSGTVSQPTFTGTEGDVSVKGTPAGSVSLTNSNVTATVSEASSGEVTYTPAGSVAAPIISVASAGSTATVKNPTSVTVAKTVATAAPGATTPDNPVTMYSVSGEVLSLYQVGYTTGDSITTENVTVKTGDASYEASAPAFTGTGARLVTGNISVPSSASFSGSEMTSIGKFTPEGTVSQPTFSGTAGTVTVS